MDVTDLGRGWADMQAVRNVAECRVFAALCVIGRRFAFALCGVDTGIGSWLVSEGLYRYCRDKGLGLSGWRPYERSDICRVEEVNDRVVRGAGSYLRYETERDLELFNRLYAVLRPYRSFFQGVVRLVELTGVGSRVYKGYDSAERPYQRLLAWAAWEPQA